MLEVANLILVVGGDTTAHEVRQRARCHNCGVKGNNTYQDHANTCVDVVYRFWNDFWKLVHCGHQLNWTPLIFGCCRNYGSDI